MRPSRIRSVSGVCPPAHRRRPARSAEEKRVLRTITRLWHAEDQRLTEVFRTNGQATGFSFAYEEKIVSALIDVSGKVTSEEDGEELPGVNVLVKGTAIGTVTDVNGNYRIEVPDAASVLVFSSIGFLSREVTVGNQTEINVILPSDVKSLEEVVVVGYGTQKKSNLTGAVSSVEPSDIQETPITSIDQGLVGRASGVMVTQTSGMPGAVASIRIRGSSSLQGGNEPLYVIDGFPIYNGGGYGNTGGAMPG